MAHTYIVTGASRGLGLEMVRQLRARGETVIGTVRSPKDEAQVKELGAEVMRLEMSDSASIEAFAAALRGRPIDVLVNNAGVSAKDAALSKLSMEEFQRVFTTNVFGPMLLAKALVPNLKTGGRKFIANISSLLGSHANAWGGFSWAYCSSKSALNMLTVLAAKELHAEGFTVVTFSPGWNRTDMGGPDAPLDPRDGIRSLLSVMDRITSADNGKFISEEGKPIAW